MNKPTGKGKPKYTGLSSVNVSLMPAMAAKSTASCRDDQDSKNLEKPGYTLCHWVDGFLETPVGRIPKVKTVLETKDRIATGLVRCGINRHQYRICPGLYAVGRPDANSEVLVTANFKLTFDQVRTELSGQNLWVLVLDTKGINVWCAAGKGSFGTRELTDSIQRSNLKNLVAHKRLILPQLGATGVSARKVKQSSGFRVIYGPVRAADIPKFLAAGKKAVPAMREVTFNFMERLILTPVEIRIILKPALLTALVIFILSGIGTGFFSFSSAWSRGLSGVAALGAGLFSGAVITPALLPYIPVKEFALKGIISGAGAALMLLMALPTGRVSVDTGFALGIFTIAVSSFLAMNFTGTTPFTSPSGVEKEMKRYMPVQMACLLIASILWIYGGFAQAA